MNKIRKEVIIGTLAANFIMIVVLVVISRLFFYKPAKGTISLGNASYNRKIQNAITVLIAQNKNYKQRYLKANETERTELFRRIENNNKEIRRLQKTIDESEN